MKTIFVVIPRRVSVRYLLSAGFLDQFKGEKLNIIVVSSITDEKFKKEFEREGVQVISIPMRDEKEGSIEKVSRILRNYVGGVGQRMQTFSAKSHMFGKWQRMLYIFSVPICYCLLPFRRLLRYTDMMLWSRLIDKKYEELFDRFKPDLVYIHSVLELTAVPICRVAKRKKIPTIGTVLSWDNLGNKGEVYCHTDKLIVWNEMMKGQAVRYHNYKSSQVFVFGSSQFDFYLLIKDALPTKEEFFQLKKLNLNKKLILYTTSPERIGGSEEIEAIRGLQHAMQTKLPNCQMLLRVYSKDAINRYLDFFNDANIIIDDPKIIMTNPNDSYAIQDKNFFIDLASEVRYADVVVNCMSTVTLDAALFNTPTINVSFGRQVYWLETGHYSAVVRHDGAVMANSVDDLVVKIKDCLQDKNLNKAGREAALLEVCGMIDGKTLERTKNLILKELTI